MDTNMTRVLVGGTFACDAAIAQPLEILLAKAVNIDIAIEWLPYGSAADLSSLQVLLQRSAYNLVLLLVRLSDHASAHPELVKLTGATEDFYHQLATYDARTDTNTPPLVVLFCPSPPASEPHAADKEAALRERIHTSLHRISCLPSSSLLCQFEGDPLEWYDAIGDRREHAPFTQSMLNAIALACTRQLCRVVHSPTQHQPKKVLVLDCDNTLWGGAVADVGAESVELSDRFLAVQRFALHQQQRGVLVCLCSKNIEHDVRSVFLHRSQDMVLNLHDHIVASKVNWRPKSANICELADELALGLDSFVFVDDNAVECDEVARHLPMVTVIHLPTDFDRHFPDQQWVFDTPLVAGTTTQISDTPTSEDSARTQLYQQNALRSQLQRCAPSQAAFLSSLGLRIECDRLFDPASPSFARVLQLLKRTNTFNTTTTFARSTTHESLAEFMASQQDQFVLASSVTDRYGHYGLVCVAMVRVVGHTAHIVSLIMSCRVLNRGVEHAMLNRIAQEAQTRGAIEVAIDWEPTVRNEPVRVFLGSLSSTHFVGKDGGAAVTRRDEKLRVSAMEAGAWTLSVEDALGVSFLKEVDATSTWYRQWKNGIYSTLVALVRWLAQRTPLGWLLQLVAWLKRSPTVLGMPSQTHGVLRVDVHRRELLDAFLSEHGVTAAAKSTVDDGPVDGETDEAFRLRVRYKTKHLLLDHVAEDVPRVVWTPQHSEMEDDDGDRSELLQQFHRPCKTPSCSATVYWESKCELDRCRTCCYKVQRLLTRATNAAVHPRAREAARQGLRDDFNVTGEVTETRGMGCVAHTNDSRRK